MNTVQKTYELVQDYYRLHAKNKRKLMIYFDIINTIENPQVVV